MCVTCDVNRSNPPACHCVDGYYPEIGTLECKECNFRCVTCVADSTEITHNCIVCAANRIAAPDCHCQVGWYNVPVMSGEPGIAECE